jgi:Ankyrin repeats (3 copies)
MTMAVNLALISRKRSLLDISCSMQQPIVQQKIARVMSDLPARLLPKNKQKVMVSSPQDFLMAALVNVGVNAKIHPFDTVDGLFFKPSPAEIASYSSDIINAVRKKDLDTLRQMLKEGRPLKCSNQFGESILHLACRKGLIEVVEFLVNEANVPLWVKDDFGRTPLHDACWTIEPDFKMVDIILDRCPDLLFISDARAHTPLTYVRQENWSRWNDYLQAKLATGSLKPKSLF